MHGPKVHGETLRVIPFAGDKRQLMWTRAL